MAYHAIGKWQRKKYDVGAVQEIYEDKHTIVKVKKELGNELEYVTNLWSII